MHTPLLPQQPCYLNGAFIPLDQARVSVLDRGFVFGDGVYEVIPVYNLRLFRAADHLDRLSQSLAGVDIPNPLSHAQWLQHCQQLVTLCAEHTGQTDQLVYIQVTRGVAERSWNPPSNLAPTVFMMANAHQAADHTPHRHGVSAVTTRDLRWSHGMLKTTSLMGHVLARQAAIEADAAEVLMIHNGYLTEGSCSNIWIVFEDALLTPPPGEHVLAGVRLRVIHDLCEELDIACSQRPIPEFELRAASEIMLSSASHEWLPITQLDGEPVGHGAGRGRPGPVFARLYEAYQTLKRQA